MANNELEQGLGQDEMEQGGDAGSQELGTPEMQPPGYTPDYYASDDTGMGPDALDDEDGIGPTQPVNQFDSDNE